MDRYGFDVLSSDPHQRPKPPDIPAKSGLVVEDVETGWVGAVVRVERSSGMHIVVLEDRHGKTRSFPLGGGFWIDGRAVHLIPPPASVELSIPSRTASGSVAVTSQRARVARGSRIWVEGRHDAELIEKVWGDDLRAEGIVVEILDGADHLLDHLYVFAPSPQRRVGVLVDHLVPGSKESRLAAEAHAAFEDVLVIGHPFVDVWEAVKPERVGLAQWPAIPRHIEWKRGILEALGRPNQNQTDVAEGWKWILSQVRDFRDLDATLLGRVEELIDFTTVGHSGS